MIYVCTEDYETKELPEWSFLGIHSLQVGMIDRLPDRSNFYELININVLVVVSNKYVLLYIYANIFMT